MKTKEHYLCDIKQAEIALSAAQKALADFLSLPENNKFTDLDDAVATIEVQLRDKASNDCEGSYNRGFDTYKQLFMVNEDTYLGVLTCEYDRYVKTYYYLEEADFTYTKQ